MTYTVIFPEAASKLDRFPLEIDWNAKEEQAARLPLPASDDRIEGLQVSFYEEKEAYCVEILASNVDPSRLELRIDRRCLSVKGVQKIPSGERWFSRTVRTPFALQGVDLKVKYNDPALLIRFGKPSRFSSLGDRRMVMN